MKSSAEIRRTMDVPPTIHVPLPPTSYPAFDAAIFTDIGGRKHQEDRFTLCPQLVPGRDDCAFFGVFDGTVGDFASENVKDLVVPQLISSPAWQEVTEMLRSDVPATEVDEKLPQLLDQAVDDMYKNADNELVKMCEQLNKDYASSTSVTAVLAKGFVAVGHLGDSRIAMGVETPNGLNCEFLTVDHKPDMPHEKLRIMRNGGSVEYLHNHNNKPFIRGGDFSFRKSRGEQPMQLQYSRAFGGKDLKMYGLSNQPDVRVVRVTPQHRVMILATDGLWDVMSAAQAVEIAMQARQEGRNPAQALVEMTLAEQQSRNQSADNITAMTVFFKKTD
ncbi:serine-threonine phosophatase 2C (PP2C) [Toxoplasma gondii TgCatPRC2]|uniref:Serine-threonine phosophatase 2C n=15 Tax=Toxoplasma gondii TaxID=5811 RepID=A0A0F7UXX2_TOXGV|nr:serine-threonine phosophatase 2C (PP2C) [Toxoplasma gondii ME49]EPR64296.1 serine-threonine phosophatase 2C (PP2C) [Toxoplasma gondii GT1]ESS35704.1 serine-threonine phosophatase 2C (PP2C) [Toxoplasma gondii VEG]KAF4641780.1 serine-threonine phosophatase 2C (PP2C) [Toxoplasma gondii]KFG48569.1 serine-threonine phosophatase 2C (PP2C) [Toxoplasma gondii GAB2-2007-GAL-DOM2]KFG51071.1 serine-threonine phosophatase 2C (PP2C) [Toxoplasma gondii p89]KFG55369.1 serine-threonine phosophatase 2C (PP|eukprot:XP_002368056.1 serine-threonine phosophatase 2C (PP2C) [Toxoplasma gondii ME49]